MSLEERIIPALAGNTQPPWWSSWFHPDHPRSRGEYLSRDGTACSVHGSSPLSRGILTRSAAARAARGIIPALAGNTHSCLRRRSPPSDHPRSRGEYVAVLHVKNPSAGSSPLSRGILGWDDLFSPSERIIPALAGNTDGLVWTTPPTTDHPRSRGEYRHFQGQEIFWLGSSPLSRGILRPRGPITGDVRIIPALAGNTPVWFVRGLFPGDHPRSRGEYAAEAARGLLGRGSSPLSRGIRCRHWVPSQ